ncbi:MAG: ferredoxin [Bacteriovoracaceae bacterium]|nr:ferredoxin [Bacteriovoracaceae bacterium]
MASKSEKTEKNVDGKYFVDSQCIACGACITEASEFFEMDDDSGFAYVKAQPEFEVEEEVCVNAMNVCPVDAIGED